MQIRCLVHPILRMHLEILQKVINIGGTWGALVTFLRCLQCLPRCLPGWNHKPQYLSKCRHI